MSRRSTANIEKYLRAKSAAHPNDVRVQLTLTKNGWEAQLWDQWSWRYAHSLEGEGRTALDALDALERKLAAGGVPTGDDDPQDDELSNLGIGTATAGENPFDVGPKKRRGRT